MLDQNTDRMWYVIGAVIVGAAIIFLVNSSFPQLFASVGNTFKDKTEDVSGVVADIDTTQPNRNLVTGSDDYSRHKPAFDAVVTMKENVHVPEWKTTNAAQFTLRGGTSFVKSTRTVYLSDYYNQKATLSVYVKNLSDTPMKVESNGVGYHWDVVAPGESKRVVLTGAIRDTYEYVQLRFNGMGPDQDLDFVTYGFKIELGDKATKYVPG